MLNRDVLWIFLFTILVPIVFVFGTFYRNYHYSPFTTWPTTSTYYYRPIPTSYSSTVFHYHRRMPCSYYISPPFGSKVYFNGCGPTVVRPWIIYPPPIWKHTVRNPTNKTEYVFKGKYFPFPFWSYQGLIQHFSSNQTKTDDNDKNGEIEREAEQPTSTTTTAAPAKLIKMKSKKLKKKSSKKN